MGCLRKADLETRHMAGFSDQGNTGENFNITSMDIEVGSIINAKILKLKHRNSPQKRP